MKTAAAFIIAAALGIITPHQAAAQQIGGPSVCINCTAWQPQAAIAPAPATTWYAVPIHHGWLGLRRSWLVTPGPVVRY